MDWLNQLRIRWTPPPDLTVSEWADQFRRLSPESSAEPGQWRTSRTPYLRDIMDSLNDPTVESIVVMSSAQVGKTECVNNIVGYLIDQDPAPMLVLQPTLQMGEAWSKDRLAPMLRDTPALHGRIADARARDSGNTLLHKTFPGGHITIAGANSPASLASRPVRVVLCDEVDRYPVSAGTEGDPVSLARKRTATFWNRKILLTSTPTIKGESRIEAAYEDSSRSRYWVPCEHCNKHQVLRWAQVSWPDGEPDAAAYACEHCGALWSDTDKLRALPKGEWRAEVEGHPVAGFHLNEIYSPWVSFAQMARAFLEAKKMPETLKTWVNTALGETWEEAGEGISDSNLLTRREAYDTETLPEGVIVLTAGVDVQDNRLELEVVGHGVDHESWGAEHKVLYGDPACNDVWADLDEALRKTYATVDGRKMRIAATCVDSGGHHTSAVYDWTKERAGRRIHAVKGADGARAPWPKRATRTRRGSNLFVIGVDSLKESIYSRLRIGEPGPGYCHFPDSYDAEFFEQLTSEHIVTRYSRGYPRRVWQLKRGKRNEGLDLRVYALAALASLNVRWSKLAAKTATIEPAPEPVEPEPAPEPPKAPKRRRPPRRGGGFVNSWR